MLCAPCSDTFSNDVITFLQAALDAADSDGKSFTLRYDAMPELGFDEELRGVLLVTAEVLYDELDGQ